MADNFYHYYRWKLPGLRKIRDKINKKLEERAGAKQLVEDSKTESRWEKSTKFYEWTKVPGATTKLNALLYFAETDILQIKTTNDLKYLGYDAGPRQKNFLDFLRKRVYPRKEIIKQFKKFAVQFGGLIIEEKKPEEFGLGGYLKRKIKYAAKGIGARAKAKFITDPLFKRKLRAAAGLSTKLASRVPNDILSVARRLLEIYMKLGPIPLRYDNDKDIQYSFLDKLPPGPTEDDYQLIFNNVALYKNAILETYDMYREMLKDFS